MAKVDIFNLQPNEPKAILEHYVFAIYGRAGAGKTKGFVDLVKHRYGDLTSGIIAAFEKGYNAIKGVYAQILDSWENFQTMVNQLVTGKSRHKFRFIAMDTVDEAWTMVVDYVLRTETIRRNPDTPYTNLTQIGRGDGWNIARIEFKKQVLRLQKAGFGIFFISHDKDKKKELQNGDKYDYTQMALNEGIREVIKNMADFIIYLSLEARQDASGNMVEDRIAYLRGEGSIEAKCRFDDVPNKFPWSVPAFSDIFDKAILSASGEDTDIEALRQKQYEELERESAEYAERDNPELAAQFHKQIEEGIAKLQAAGKDLTVVANEFLSLGVRGGIYFQEVSDIKVLQDCLEVIAKHEGNKQ